MVFDMSQEASLAAPLCEDEGGTLVIPDVAPEGTATSHQLTINLIVCAGAGSGLFTLPWSTAGASLISAILIEGVVLFLTGCSLCIIVEAAERHQCFDLAGLMGKLPGRMGTVNQAICNVGIWIGCFLALVGYINIMASAAESLIPIATRPWMLVLVTVLMVPMCFLEQRYLSFSSVLAVVVSLYIFGVMVFKGTEEHSSDYEGICILGIGKGSIAMFSALTYTLAIQMCVPPMYLELKDRSPAKFRRIVIISFSALLVLFALFGSVGYLAFGATSPSNILNAMGGSPFEKVAVVGGSLVVAAVYPILGQAMAAPIRSMRHLPLRQRQISYAMTMVLIVLASGVTAVWLTDLGFLSVVNGAFSCGLFMGLCPSLIGLYLLGTSSRSLTLRMWGLLVFSAIMSVVGLVYTDNYLVDVAANSSCWLR